MGRLRLKLDSYFEQLGIWIVNHKWVILAGVMLLTALMASRLPYTRFDMSTESFLHEDDPSIMRYNAFREQFGRDEMIVLMIKPDNVFDLSFLETLRSFHEDLEEQVPHLNDITSLINARYTKGAEDELIVEDLMEEFPQSEDDLVKLKEKVLSNPLYVNLLISEDGTLTTLLIKSDAYSSKNTNGFLEEVASVQGFQPDSSGRSGTEGRKLLTNEENARIVQAVRNVMKQYNSEKFPVFLSGSPVVTEYLKASMQTDMGRFTVLAILAIALFLFMLFRRVSGVLLPLLTVVLSVIFTFGLMELTDTALKLPLVILPSFLLAVGVGASVHLMTVFYKFLNQSPKSEAISKALGHSGLPIMMTSITTSVGLASFSQAELAPAADLGVYASIGVIISLLLTLLLIPSLISILPMKPARLPKTRKNVIERGLKACGDIAVDHHLKVIGIALIMAVFGIAGIFRLDITHHVLFWFPEGSEIRENTELIDTKMKGTLTTEIVLDTKKENGLYDPEFLNTLESLARRIEAYPSATESMFVGKTISLTDLLKEINQALNENDPEFYAVPQARDLVAQELFLFENSGSDDLKDMVDSQFSKTRLTIKVPWNDSVTYIDFFNYLEESFDDLFGSEVEFTMTGIIDMMMKTVFAMMRSTIQSYSIAIGVVSLLMILLLGNFRLGLLSMIPNLTPIVLTLGIMGWSGINLDMFSMLIGSIAIGLAVDDTIHFFHNFRKHFDSTGNVKQAVQETLATTGKAMLVTTLVLASGFWLFMFATMDNLFYFGLLTGLTLVFAFLADVILAPALLALVVKEAERNN